MESVSETSITDDPTSEFSALDSDSGWSPNKHIRASRLASCTEYAAIWEELNACEEVAFSDCPDYKLVSSILKGKRKIPNDSIQTSFNHELHFDNHPSSFLKTSAKDSQLLSTDSSSLNNEKYPALVLRWASELHSSAVLLSKEGPGPSKFLLADIAEASKPTSPWSLPAIQRTLTEIDTQDVCTRLVLSVTEFIPNAALALGSSHSSVIAACYPLLDPAAYESAAGTDEVISKVQDSLSPFSYPSDTQFFSTVFITSEQLEGDADLFLVPNFYVLRRISHLATTTLLRQLEAFSIRTPVFGVLLWKSLVAIHVDWIDDTLYGDSICNSAFFPSDDVESDLKVWDLREADEALEVTFILRNLRDYTDKEFASRIVAGITISAQARILSLGDFVPWKWSETLIPPVKDLARDVDEVDEADSTDYLNEWTVQLSNEMDHDEEKQYDVPIQAESKTSLGKGSLLQRIILPSPPSTPDETFAEDPD